MKFDMPISLIPFDIHKLIFILRCGKVVLYITNKGEIVNITDDKNIFIQSNTPQSPLTAVWRRNDKNKYSNLFMILKISPSSLSSNMVSLLYNNEIDQLNKFSMMYPQFTEINQVDNRIFILYPSEYMKKIFSELVPLCNICRTLCYHYPFTKIHNNTMITPCGCNASAWIVHGECIETYLRENKKMVCDVCQKYYRVGNIASSYWYNRLIRGAFMEFNPFATSLSFSRTKHNLSDWDEGTPENEKYTRDNTIPLHIYQSILHLFFPRKEQITEYTWKISNKHVWLCDLNHLYPQWSILLRLLDCHYRIFCVHILEINNKENEKEEYLFKNAIQEMLTFSNTRKCFILYVKNIQKKEYIRHVQWMEDSGMTRHTHPYNAPFTLYQGIHSTGTIVMKSHASYSSYESMLWKKYTHIHSVFTEEEIFSQFQSCKAH
jgi:hypothetical protein